MNTETAIDDAEIQNQLDAEIQKMMDQISSVNMNVYDNTNYLHVGTPWDYNPIAPNKNRTWGDDLEVQTLKLEIGILKKTIEDLEDQLREEREKVSPSELSDAKKALEELL